MADGNRAVTVWRWGVVAGVAVLVLWGCGGGSGARGDAAGEEVVYPSAVSLVDGRVGDSPFYDDGSERGLADGRAFLVRDGTPLTISWTPSARQLNQDPETALAGYRVYYGHKAGNYDYVIEIGDPSVQTIQLTGFAGGTYYFAVSAVDNLNREGPLSVVASTRVN